MGHICTSVQGQNSKLTPTSRRLAFSAVAFGSSQGARSRLKRYTLEGDLVAGLGKVWAAAKVQVSGYGSPGM